MADDPQKELDKENKPKTVHEFGFLEKELPTFYTNNAQFSSTEMDLRIDLGEIQDSETLPDGTLKIRVVPKARVFMSWPFALRFYKVMQDQIKKQKTQVFGAHQE